MDLATIEVDRTEARRRFLEYRKSVRARHNAEDEQIMRGYRALSQGKQIIDIVATMRNGGVMEVNEQTRTSSQVVRLPKLAVMRADQPWCWLETWNSGSFAFVYDQFYPSNARRNIVRFPINTLPVTRTWQSYRAMVPPVPPGLRPADNIGNYHILFEAEWKAEPPGDPALLKHIGGDLYAVLAVWNLTELECSVLGGRFR